jgi:FtsZ-binding cell division protein ZapB
VPAVDVFSALENRVERVIQKCTALQARVAELEKENARLSSGSGELVGANARIAELEREREEVRERLERLSEKLRLLGE